MKKAFVKELAQLLVDLRDVKVAENVLHNLLTPAELEEVSTRLQIFKLLKQGVPQRKISEKLGVSVATISRGSRELQHGKPGIVTVVS